ncbi:hypothetical protein H4Q26_016097 [Puccinia striiformis f. sp. tritici PST-130]|nr:hypothetical protein H4Q26_016097 [Puccinia striiformis f. sp. tritici PST-130]
MTRREKTGPSSDHSRTPSGTMSDEEGTASTERGSSPLKLSPEAQMKIIEDTGILDRIPMRRFADVGSGPASSSANRKAPWLSSLLTRLTHSRRRSNPLQFSTMMTWRQYGIPKRMMRKYRGGGRYFAGLGRSCFRYFSVVDSIHNSICMLRRGDTCSVRLHYHEQILANLLLFGLSTIGGSYMVYIMNRLSYLLVMRRVPPLGALWIYSVVRMHLSHAVLSLLLVALWAWVMNLSIYV